MREPTQPCLDFGQVQNVADQAEQMFSAGADVVGVTVLTIV